MNAPTNFCVLVGEDEFNVTFHPDGMVVASSPGREDQVFSYELETISKNWSDWWLEGNSGSRDFSEHRYYRYACEEYFWDEIVPQLEYSMFDPDSLVDQPLIFKRGNQEEFERLMRVFILTEPPDEILPPGPRYYHVITVSSETDEEAVRLDGYDSERFQRLFGLLIAEHTPYGWTWEYNDGNGQSRDGYSCYPIDLTYDVEQILSGTTVRDRMIAFGELRRWLEGKGLDPVEFLA